MAKCTMDMLIPGPPKAIKQVAIAKPTKLLETAKSWKPAAIVTCEMTLQTRGPNRSRTNPNSSVEAMPVHDAMLKIMVESASVIPHPPFGNSGSVSMGLMLAQPYTRPPTSEF